MHSTWDCIGRQLAGREHDVAEVEGCIVHAAQLLVSLVGGREVFEWRLYPLEAGEVAPCKHVHVRMLRRFRHATALCNMVMV